MPTVPPDPGLQNLVVDNSDPPDNQVVAAPLAFTNQQLWIALTDGNCDFSKFRGDGRDFQAYDSDGSTPLVTSLRSWRLGSVGLRFHSRFSVPAGPSPSRGPYVHAGTIDCADLGYPNPPHTVVAYQTQAGDADGKQQGQLRCYDRNMAVLWTWTSPGNDSVNDFTFADLDADGILDTILAGTSRIDRSVYALSLANPPATKWVYPFSTQGNTYIRAIPTEGNLRHDLPGNEVLVSGSEGVDSNSAGVSHGKIAILDSSGNVLATANQDPSVPTHTTQDAIIADLLGTGQTSVFAAQATHIYKYSNVLGSPIWMTTHDGNRNYYSLAAGHLTSKTTRVIAAVAGVAVNDAYIGILTVIDDSGLVLWERPLAAHGYGVKCVDLDGDGWDELIVSTGTAAGGPTGLQFGPPYQGWGVLTIFDHLGNEIFAITQPSPTKHISIANFDGTGRLQLQGPGDDGRVMRWNVDAGVKSATVKVIVPSIPWKSTRDLWFGSTGAATQPPRGDRYFDFTGADGSAPANLTPQIGAWTIQGGMIASPDDADAATAACLEAADVSTEAFEWEFTAYKPGQGTGSSTYYNAARYRCTSWSAGRPDGYNWQHAQNGQVALQRTASGTGTVTYQVTTTPVSTVTFNATDKMAYRCVVFGDWHALYVNKNDTGFKQLYNLQDLNAGRKSSAGSVAFLSQRGQTKIAASTIWTFKNQDGNSGTGPVPFLYSLDDNGTATLPVTAGHRLLESGAARLLESGSFRLLEGSSVAVATGHRLLESGAARLLESGAFRLLEGASVAVVAAGHRLLESGAARLLESGAFRLLEGDSAVVAAGYALGGPSSAAVGIASGPFTASLVDPVGSPVTVTPHVAGLAGTFSPASVVIPAGSISGTFTFTPAAPGTATVSTTNDSSLVDPPALGLVASYTVPPATSYTLDGPTAATVGRPSSPFAVTLAGGALGAPVTVTPHVAGLAGTFTPATAVIPAGSFTANFTFTPAATGTATISVTNGSGLANPAARPLACANPLPPETFQAAPVVVFRPAPGPGFAKTFVPRRPPVRRVVRRGR